MRIEKSLKYEGAIYNCIKGWYGRWDDSRRYIKRQDNRRCRRSEQRHIAWELENGCSWEDCLQEYYAEQDVYYNDFDEAYERDYWNLVDRKAAEENFDHSEEIEQDFYLPDELFTGLYWRSYR